MELSKKLTILVTPEMHEMLVRVSKERAKSIGELIRSACERQYGGPTLEERRRALQELISMNLPVADVATMKAESIEPPEPLS